MNALGIKTDLLKSVTGAQPGIFRVKTMSDDDLAHYIARTLVATVLTAGKLRGRVSIDSEGIA